MKGHFALIPTEWFALACVTRKVRAVRVGGYLWFLSGLRKRRHSLRVIARLAVLEVGGSKDTVLRGLSDLARAGLVRIEKRRPRHGMIVTLPSDVEIARMAQEAEDRLVLEAERYQKGLKLRQERVL